MISNLSTKTLLIALWIVFASGTGVSANLTVPKDAQLLVARIHILAKSRDVMAMESNMVNDFVWGFGGDGDSKQAVENWKRNPKLLDQLYLVTGQKCGFDGQTVQCPVNPGIKYRAGFQQTENGWKMIYLVAGN